MAETLARIQHKKELIDSLEHVKVEYANRPKFLQSKIEEISDELNKLKRANIYGFVIVNFPNTYNQAKLLENVMSGYVPENERQKTQVEIYKEESDLILDKTVKPIPPKTLIESGLDHVVFLDTNAAECVKRAYGRRIHLDTGKIYHLLDNPPPLNTDICENLTRIDDNGNNESTFVTRCVSFENTFPLLKEFYEPLGFSYYNLETLIRINGNSSTEEVNHNVFNVINNLLEIKEKREEELVNQQEEEDDDELNLSQAVDDLDKQSQMHDVTGRELIEASKTHEAKEVEDSLVDKMNKRLLLVKKQLSPDLADLLIKIWFRMYENYIRECKSIFKFVRKQRDFISINYNTLSQKFIDFLKRPNKKQIHLLEYQMSYNKFLDDYPDLKDDPRVKEEHHQRVDDLADKIFEIIEIRKAEAIEQRRKIMTSSWIENEMEKFYHNLERLFQAEIDKYIGSIQVIKDFYHGLDNKVLAEIPQYNIDIIKDEIDPTPLEKDQLMVQINVANTQTAVKGKNNPDPNVNAVTYNIFGQEEEFPRIEKLYKIGLRVQYQYDELLFRGEKDRQAQIAEKEAKDKKTAKANPKDAKGNKIQETVEKKEVYPNETEMKSALNLEKAKFRCRVTLLRNWGIKYLKSLRKQANEIYSKLEDWIILAIKAENEALSQLSYILKKHIEDEQKIKYELELDTFDIKINMDVVNYIEEPPKLLPAKEIIDHNKFNIQQLNILINELNTYIVSNNNIRTSNFLKIFEKKYITSKTDNDVYYGLPNSIKRLTFHNFYKFVKCFDPESTDFMNLQHVLTIFCVLHSPVCTDEDEENIKSQCEGILKDSSKLDKDEFINLPMWIDNTEGCATPPGYEIYNRVEKLKEIIFHINKDDDDQINLNELCSLLTLKTLNLYDKKNEGKTYFEVLFF